MIRSGQGGLIVDQKRKKEKIDSKIESETEYCEKTAACS